MRRCTGFFRWPKVACDPLGGNMKRAKDETKAPPTKLRDRSMPRDRDGAKALVPSRLPVCSELLKIEQEDPPSEYIQNPSTSRLHRINCVGWKECALRREDLRKSSARNLVPARHPGVSRSANHPAYTWEATYTCHALKTLLLFLYSTVPLSGIKNNNCHVES